MLAVGDKAKDFDLPNCENKRVKLFDYLDRHGPVALVFYKYDCPTCQFTIPHLTRVSSALGNEHFLAVAQDTPAEAVNFRNKYKFGFEVACGVKPYAVSKQYGIAFVPTIFIIEKDRKISHVSEGFDKAAIESFSMRLATEKNIGNFVAFDPASQVPLLKPG